MKERKANADFIHEHNSKKNEILNQVGKKNYAKVTVAKSKRIIKSLKEQIDAIEDIKQGKRSRIPKPKTKRLKEFFNYKTKITLKMNKAVYNMFTVFDETVDKYRDRKWGTNWDPYKPPSLANMDADQVDFYRSLYLLNNFKSFFLKKSSIQNIFTEYAGNTKDDVRAFNQGSIINQWLIENNEKWFIENRENCFK